MPHGQQLWYKYVLWKISTHTENLTVCGRKQVASMQKIGVVTAFKASSSKGSRSIYLQPATALTALKALLCVTGCNLICRNLRAQNLFCLNLLRWTCILHRTIALPTKGHVTFVTVTLLNLRHCVCRWWQTGKKPQPP